VQIQPRYDGPTILRFDGPLIDIATPLVRQRRRLGKFVAGLSAEGWAHETRCDRWSVREVIVHLSSTTQFWIASANGALSGTPTRYLPGFDPAVTPGLLVDGAAHLSVDEVAAQYDEGVAKLADALGDLNAEQWESLAEAPPGHIALHAMARHALWDGWTHERDIAIPLGQSPVEEADEVVASLEYVAGLGPSFVANVGSTRVATIVVDGHDPEIRIVVEAGESVVVRRGGNMPDGAIRISGPAVDLIEALSYRSPFPVAIEPDDRWIFDGLGAVFDQVATS
jgi:uncharacterized protein (TIGR03083 family)